MNEGQRQKEELDPRPTQPKEKVKLPFDPIERAEQVESVVTKGHFLRRYHRFRKAPYYGGIATADAVGCCFLCAYCWSFFRNCEPQRHGKFYWPEQVGTILLDIAHKCNFNIVRITGSEPILGEGSFNHLEKVIKYVGQMDSSVSFVLETNGLFLGYKPEFIEKLKNFPKLYIRVAIKGWDPETFEQITGAKKEFFLYPLKAIKALRDSGLSHGVAVMEDLFGPSEIKKLQSSMKDMNLPTQLELETLEKYPYVMENLKERGIKMAR